MAGSALPPMPDGLAFDVHGNVYVTVLTRTHRGGTALFVLGRTWPGAALVKVPAGAPGRPLH